MENLGYNEGTLPVRYLGIPLISTRLNDADCSPVLDNIRKRFQSWSARFLSYVGRLQLINSVMFHLQSFWSAIVILPCSIFKKIEELCRNFLWSGHRDQKAIPLVAWDRICLPRNEGGLGVK